MQSCITVRAEFVSIEGFRGETLRLQAAPAVDDFLDFGRDEARVGRARGRWLVVHRVWDSTDGSLTVSLEPLGWLRGPRTRR